MKIFRNLFETIFNILLLGLLIYAWIMYAPQQVGGPASYVIIQGVSMLPTMRAGDLAILRRDSTYQVGEIVAYREVTDNISRNVIHRIIGIDQGRFILQGDNNPQPDSTHPTQDEILGKLTFHLPVDVGTIFSWVRLPKNGVISAGLIGGVFMALMLLQPSKKGTGEEESGIRKSEISALENIPDEIQTASYRQPAPRPAPQENFTGGLHTMRYNKDSQAAPRPEPQEIFSGRLPPAARQNKDNQPASRAGQLENVTAEMQTSLYLLGFVALVFLLVCIFAFTQPTEIGAAPFNYQQSGVFFYSAMGKPGIYDTDKVQSGEPIFPSLTCQMNIGFVYNITGGDLQNVNGMHLLTARISDEQSGWQRSIPLIGDTTFNGTSYSTAAAIDLCQIESLVNSVEAETNFKPSTYNLVITPHVAVTGQLDGQQFNDAFEPSLNFKFDEVHFYFVNGKTVEPGSDPMLTTKKSSLPNPARKLNTFSLFGYDVGIADLRTVGLLGMGLSLLGFAALGWFVYTTASRSQEAMITVKYGARIMNVYDRGFENLPQVVDVTSIDDLARLAELQNTVIMHITRENLHYYLVQTSRATYRYVLSEGKRAALKAAQGEKG